MKITIPPQIPEGVSQTPEGLKIERSQGVVTLTIDRASDMNRLTPELLTRLLSIADSLRDDIGANVLVLTGSGREIFSAGILNPVLRAGYTKDEIIQLVRLANRTFNAIESLPQIVIAAINGKVIAGAVELCLTCDIRYASNNVTFTMPEANWGGFPGAGGPVRLPTHVGRSRALEMICTGREFNSEELLRFGLVLEVFSPESMLTSVGKIARQISDSGPLAVKGAKRIVNTRLEPGLQAALTLSDSLRQSLEWSHDVDEGIAAHKENRRPIFIGR